MILMDRAEAIAFFESKKTALEKSEHILLGRNAYDAFCSAVDALREQEQREWISAEERLPEDGVRVLTACDDGVVRLGISKGGFPSVVNRSHRFSDVTHWIPLPKPPKD